MSTPKKRSSLVCPSMCMTPRLVLVPAHSPSDVAIIRPTPRSGEVSDALQGGDVDAEDALP
jgi:hypothetical protein